MAGSRQDIGVMIATYAALYNQRIGQFLDNVMTQEGVNDDLFYVTDDRLVDLIGIYVTVHPPTTKGL